MNVVLTSALSLLVLKWAVEFWLSRASPCLCSVSSGLGVSLSQANRMQQAEAIRPRKGGYRPNRQARLFPVRARKAACVVVAVPALFGGLGIPSPAAGLATNTPFAMTDEFAGFNFRKEHGLPDDDVRDILQTRDGSLWALTQQGLARFDGAAFTVYDRGNTPDFRDEDPRSLAEDSRGRLWVGGKNMLLRMTANSLQRVVITPDGAREHGFQLCPDMQGGMWIGGETTVTHFTDEQVKVFGAESGLITGGNVRALQMDSSGRLFVGTFDGFFRFDQERQRFVPAIAPVQPGDKPVTALTLHAGRSRRLWARFAQFHDPRYFHGFSGWVAFQQEDAWVSPLNAGKTRLEFGRGLQFLFEDSRGDLWVSGIENQLHRIHAGEHELLRLNLPGHPDIATCLREDHEGSLWMGTLRSGLWRWQPRRMQVYSTMEGLPQENVWALCEGADGAVWVGTDDGLARSALGKWQVWRSEQGLSRNNIRALAVDQAGTVWIGTGQGLNSLRDGKVTRHPIPGDWFEAKIRVILPARDGALWVAGAASLHRLSNGNRTKFTTAEGLANNDVRALLEDSSGRLWIGTFGGGLQCYEQGRFTTYSTTNGLANGFVWALHQDQAGALWIGTESGLYRLRDGHITTFGKAQGLPDNLVNFILEDDFGQLWISHDRGIYRVRRAALDDVAEGRTNLVRCVSYTKADGLPSEETNGQKSYPPGCKSRDGRLWFATTKGVVVIDPKLHQTEAVPPSVVIDGLRATGHLVFSRNPEDPLSPEHMHAPKTSPSQPGDSPSPVGITAASQLPSGSGRVLEFSYTANTFADANRARFKYRLIGLDDQWIEAGTRRQAVFTNLKPGNYRFQVIAANHQGIWNETGATYAFRIAPFYYETWWFYSLCGALIVAGVGGAVAWRMRELRRLHRLERQTAVATERSRIAQDLHDGLGADLTRLTALADLASDAATVSSRDQLRKLAQHSRAATRGLKDLIWMANPANDTLESFLDRLCQNAEDFLQDTSIACRFDLASDLPPLALPLDTRRNLLLVAREALNNVVRHSGATEVLITARRRAGNLELALADNGHGFDGDRIRSDALGLSGMRRRVEGIGGRFELQSGAGSGTLIQILIPWPTREHARTQE